MIDSRQRVIAAMNFMTPIRVALICQFSIGFMMNRLKSDPVMFWYDMKTFANGWSYSGFGSTRRIRYRSVTSSGGGKSGFRPCHDKKLRI